MNLNGAEKNTIMIDIFFYGLFMDQDLLLKKGLNPSNPRQGSVEVS
jgi:hypothetical protein